MKRPMLVCSLVLLTISVLAPAKDFPLEFRTLNTEEVKGNRWSYGANQRVVATKPARLKNEPKAASAHPLYGEFKWADKTSMLFRVDESKGEGKGYDQIIFDLNQNGDLTDDAIIAPTADVQHWSNYKGRNTTLFGPFEAPASKHIGKGRSSYYAVLDVQTNAIENLRKKPTANNALGYLRLKAGYYLETTVEMDGHKQKVAILDNDANMRLGNLCVPHIKDDQWYLGAADGDRLLLKKDGSSTNLDSLCFSQLFYLGADPYQIALTTNCGALRVERWPGPLAEVSLQPQGSTVRGLGLGWESAKDQWQFFEAGIADGKIKVPPGRYGLWCTLLSAKNSQNEEATAGGGTEVRKVFSVEVGKKNTILCGTPITIKASAMLASEKGAPNGVIDMLQRGIEKLFSPKSDDLNITAEILGSGGETYYNFNRIDAQGKTKLAKPIFTIVVQGKQIASGNLEFG